MLNKAPIIGYQSAAKINENYLKNIKKKATS